VKRGLVVLDETEIEPDEWTTRIAALQSDLKAQGVDVALIYNDVSRGDDLGYLTNLVIYWNEGVLAVPAEGHPTLLTKLSKRVFAWMDRVSTLDDLRSGKTFDSLVAAYVAELPPGTIGFVDAALWPESVMNDIAAAVPEWRIAELGSLVRDRRALPSEAELALLRQGATVLRDALAEATAPGLDMRERSAAIDRITRHAGFADALIRRREDGAHVTIEVAGEYRHGWLMAGRTFGDESWLPALAEAQQAVFAVLRPGVGHEAIANAAEAALAALPDGAITSVRWVSQADFANGGELQRLPDSGPADGEVVALVIEAIDRDGVRSVLTDTVQVTAGGAVPLTVAEQRS
jgi:Xaa-Pro aminopeptidase